MIAILADIDLHASAATLLGWIGQAVLYGTLLALATWLLLSSAMRRARPAIHAMFWLVVLLKFVLPSGPGWSYSLATMVERLTPATTLAPRAAPEPAMITVTAVPLADWDSPGAASGSANVAAAPAVAPPATVPWLTLLCAAYLGGLLIVAGVRLRSYCRFAASLSELSEVDAETAKLVESLCRRSGVRRVPRVRISDEVPAPYIVNALNPTLVLSRRQLADRDELEAVVLHEIAHLRRGDLLVRYVQWLAGTLLYFWPVVAWVNRRIDLARERACDEWALRHGRLSPAQYARCLLRATRPVRSSLVAYAPAAMAANTKHVERRIEMIINAPALSRRSRMLGCLAGATLLGWTGFVLSGANAAVGPKSTSPVTDGGASPAPLMFWNFATGDGTEDVDFVMPMMAMPLGGANGDIQMFVASEDDAADGVQRHAIAMTCIAGGPAGFGAFGNDHPSADANGDGTVNRAEHDAYLIALAMAAPQGVLTQYPQADRNSDGRLQAGEAARLVVAPPIPAMPPGRPHAGVWRANAGEKHALHADVLAKLPAEVVEKIKSAHGGAIAIATAESDSTTDDGSGPKRMRVMRKVTSENGVVTEETQENDGPVKVRVLNPGEEPQAIQDGVVVRRLMNDGDAGIAHRVRMFKADAGEAGAEVRVIAEPGPDGALPLKIALAGSPGEFNIELATPPVVWLLENVDATPSTAQVASYVALAEAAPLEHFLELNPKADANHDGTLTAQERDAYIEAHQTKMRTRVLERHPEADANGDGVLTNDEMKTFFRSRHPLPPGGEGEDVQVIHSAGGAHRVMIRRSKASEDGKEIQVEVVGGDEADGANPK